MSGFCAMFSSISLNFCTLKPWGFLQDLMVFLSMFTQYSGCFSQNSIQGMFGFFVVLLLLLFNDGYTGVQNL